MQSGDPCQHDGCDGWLIVTSSNRLGDVVVRYLRCWSCGWRPADNRWVVPAESVPKRRRRNSVLVRTDSAQKCQRNKACLW